MIKRALKYIREIEGIFKIYYVLTIIIIASYCVALLIFLAPRAALVVVNANTELMSVTETSENQGVFLLNPAWLTSDSDPSGACVHGRFSPAPQSDVTLSRQLDGELVAEVDPGPSGRAGQFVAENQTARPYTESVIIHFDKRRTKCAPAPIIRIPVTGPVTLGATYTPQLKTSIPSLTLISATINTYSRAIQWFHPFDSGGALYPAGSVTLPSGVRIRECAGEQRLVDWAGFAEVRPYQTEAADRAISFSGFTGAKQIAVTAPGPERIGGAVCQAQANSQDGPPTMANREDILGVSLLSRMVNDPSFAVISLLFTGLFVMLQTTLSVHQFHSSRRSAEAKKAP